MPALRGTHHFEERLWERYRIRLQGSEYEHMLDAIRCCDATFIRDDFRRGTEICELWHERAERFVQVVYCPEFHQIVTALHPASWQRIEGCWIQPWKLDRMVGEGTRQ